MTEWHPLDSYYIWCWESKSIKKHCIYSKSHFKSILLFGCRTSVISVSEFPKFDQQFPHNKCIYLFISKLCRRFHHVIIFGILYSLVSTMCSGISIIIILLCSECIFPYCEKKCLSLGESNDTYKYNPCLTKKYTFHPKHTQITVYPVTGMTKYKYDTKGQRDTDRTIIADQNDHGLCNNSNNSSLNRTDQSALRNIDPDMNYLSSNMTHTDTGYFDDQHFREKFKSNKNMSMFHLNIRSIPEHFIELTSYIDSLDIVFKIIAISETWLKPYHTEYIIPNYSIQKDIRFFNCGGGGSLYLHHSLQYKLRNEFKISTDSKTSFRCL